MDLLRVERRAGWALVLIVLLMLGGVIWTVLAKWEHTTTVRINKTVLSTTIANTNETRAKGLGGRDKLGANDAMLLVYNRDNRWPVWMKDMKFAIDVIWLDKDKNIVHIVKNLYPDTYPETFQPDKPARYILEVAAGTVEKSGIQIGQTAHFDLPSR